jgi:hypothetical protein
MSVYERAVEEPDASNEIKTFVPQIEEIKVIIGEDGEEYINAKDLTIAMTQTAFSMPVPTASVLEFIRRFTIELITARR